MLLLFKTFQVKDVRNQEETFRLTGTELKPVCEKQSMVQTLLKHLNTLNYTDSCGNTAYIFKEKLMCLDVNFFQL